MNKTINRRKKRVRLSKLGKLIIGGTIIGIIVIIYLINTITYRMSDEYKFLEKGYSDSDVEIILRETEKNKEQRDKLKKLRYNKVVPKLLLQKYFMFKNLDRYINYANKNRDTSLKDVVTMVNVNRDYDFYTKTKDTDTSKGDLILVNKYNKLDKNFKPDNIVEISSQYAYEGQHVSKKVYEAYRSMWNAAKQEDLTLIVTSSYRDYESQDQIWNSFANSMGEEYADSRAARAGHSEHQTGLTLDIVTYDSYNNEFEQTDEFKWLQKNAYKYGFILRFPKDKENITGYSYESWHYRYVGVDVATKIHNLGITFDEYYAYYLDK